MQNNMRNSGAEASRAREAWLVRGLSRHALPLSQNAYGNYAAPLFAGLPHRMHGCQAAGMIG